MEYFWYIIASLAAGVGTGLAGLSAATVMVPILIVLCPSFTGETGAYHATAIALASDVLGSAFTSAIYIRHKNIDLKRGWLMLMCILSMCITGSIAAWHAGQVVLGTMSLFLCVGIGIRFLLKPDTERKETVSKGAKLGLKGIIISLFFGLTIGFGTGFMGSGGGMMMLVVFTAFLGMERKSAVGTSTLIMTFTALIASVSHALIDPTLVLERLDVLLICIIAETLASIVSARFANKVDNRTVGLATGAVLTILGIVLLCLNYRTKLADIPFLLEILSCFGQYLIYLFICVMILLSVKFWLKPPKEIFRKSLHIVAYTSSLFMMYCSENWLIAALCCILFAAIVYPALCLLEHWKGYTDLFVERHPGEVKKSLLLLFCSHAVLISICWGFLDHAYIAVASILIWGIGDTMAALIGKRFGTHHFQLHCADHQKTWEGTIAMAVTSFIVGTIVLFIVSPYPWYLCVLMALVAAPAAAFVELVSHNGNDTVSVPAAVSAVLYILTLISK